MNQEYPRRLIMILGMFLLLGSQAFSQNAKAARSILNSKTPRKEKVILIERLISDEIENAGDSLHYLYNSYAYCLFNPKSVTSALEYGNKAYELGRSQTVIDSAFMQDNMRDLGFYYQQNGETRKAISFYKKAVNMDRDSESVHRIYKSLAFCLGQVQDYYSGIEYYELNEAILKTKSVSIDRLFTLYNNLLDLCRKLRTDEGYQKGVKYGVIADSLANDMLQRDITSLNEYNSFISANAKSSDTIEIEKIGKYKTKAKSLKSKIRRTRVRLYLVNTNLAQFYNQYKHSDIEKSKKYYSQALNFAQQLNDSSRVSEVYFGLGSLFERQNIDFEKSIELHGIGISYAANTDSLSLYLNYQSLAKVYARKGEYQKSIDIRNMALSLFTDISFENPSTVLTEDLIKHAQSTRLLATLTNQAETYLKYYEENKSSVTLEKSISYFDLSDRVMDLMNLNRTTWRSRLFWRESSATLYAKAIKACYLNNDVSRAFYFIEKNKALLLMEDLAEQEFKQSLTLPEVFIEEEQQLKEEIVVLENLASNASLINPSQADSLYKRLLNTKIALFSLIGKQYNSDTLLSIKPEVISLEEVQANLSNDEMVLEYHLAFDEGHGIYTGDDNGYLICITKDHSEIIELPGLKELREMKTAINHFFDKPYEIDDDVQFFTEASHNLFLRLFPTHKIQSLMTRNKVAIIPDSFLSTLSFEALSIRSDSLHHLISESEISYMYSNSFQHQLENRETSKISMLAMAPLNFKDQSIPPLTNSLQEVTNFRNNYSGKYFLNGAATRDNFLSGIKTANIIHLATHADVRESASPWIAFEDGKISLEELYLTRNKASLVFLSACNTALGKEAIGEGLMSLTRGFFYSGSETVISTLWSIDDNATTQIVDDFYINLRGGQRKSEALRNAKLTYLETHSFSELSPHFWASFVLMGRDDVLVDGFFNEHRRYFIAIGFILLLILVIVYLKKRQVSS